MNPSRQPAGIPAGGQFAAGSQPRAAVVLDDSSAGNNQRLLSEVLTHTPENMKIGEYAVVGLSWSTDGRGWNTGRTYSTRSSAAARQTREINREDCRAYIVYRHVGGTTVYLGPGVVLGTVEP